ncbi:hypothetical protein HDU80_006060 [Chytriomyces hyalinus]|nr:hypothetical protein HDU80_006060 [Chytriomyces hyalinus]
MSCVSMTNSTYCPSFAGFTAYIPHGVPVQDTASFDDYMAQTVSLGTTPTQSTMGDLIRNPSVFNCPGWDGTGLRYIQSTMCAYFAGMGSVYPVGSGSGTCNDGKPVTVPVCQQTMDSFKSSWDAVFSNTDFCPDGQNDAAASLIDFVVSVRDQLSSDSSTCLTAELAEREHCGFQSTLEATQFCETKPADSYQVPHEACCDYLDSVYASESEDYLHADGNFEIPRTSSTPRFICVQVD